MKTHPSFIEDTIGASRMLGGFGERTLAFLSGTASAPFSPPLYQSKGQILVVACRVDSGSGT